MKLTADSITDEQIRELRDEAGRCLFTCAVALGSHLLRPTHSHVHEARARCAEILNQREAKP